MICLLQLGACVCMFHKTFSLTRLLATRLQNCKIALILPAQTAALKKCLLIFVLSFDFKIIFIPFNAAQALAILILTSLLVDLI